MESREKLLERLDVAQKASLDKLDSRIGVDPSAIMLQQGANAPIVATAVTVIAEVFIDIRDGLLIKLDSISRGLELLSTMTAHASSKFGTEEHQEQVEREVDRALEKEGAPQCPECKSPRVAIDTQPDKKDEETLDYKFKYVCENCGHEWSA